MRRIAIIARENNKSLSELLGIKDGYTAFCLDELGTLLATTWRNEKTYIEKIVEQNRGLTALGDRLKKGIKTIKNKFKKDK